MNTQAVKTEIVNNVMVAMSMYMEQQTLAVLDKMRKTLGMNLKNRGIDIGIIQEIMGHSSPVVTAQYYAQSTPQTLRGVRERAAV